MTSDLCKDGICALETYSWSIMWNITYFFWLEIFIVSYEREIITFKEMNPSAKKCGYLSWSIFRSVFFIHFIHNNWSDNALKGVFEINERGCRLNAIKKRFWLLLILFLSVASIRRKLLKTTYTEERSVHTNSESCNIRLVP